MKRTPRLPALAVILTTALAACDPPAGPATAPPPPAAPEPPAIVAPASAKSRAERQYYARIEANYLAQDLLRGDGATADAPFDADDLAENFLRIAFYDEFVESGGALVAAASENRLHRWQQPVRMAVEFGASVPLEQRAADRAAIAAYVARLSRLTGLPIRLSNWRPNHTVMILNADERAAAAGRIAAAAPGASEAALRSVTEMRPETYCTVFSFSDDRTATYVSALTVIRGELPDRLRLACIHEELAQSLGLVNDYPRARPSIFNDTEEFALLTPQDELMLRMLYDRRLRPGMTLDDARPIVEALAAEYLADEI